MINMTGATEILAEWAAFSKSKNDWTGEWG
jgi:hypothetical protein